MRIYVPHMGVRRILELLFGTTLTFLTLEEFKLDKDKCCMLTMFDDISLVNVNNLSMNDATLNYLCKETGVDLDVKTKGQFIDFCYSLKLMGYDGSNLKRIRKSINMQMGFKFVPDTIDIDALEHIGSFITSVIQRLPELNRFEAELYTLHTGTNVTIPNVWDDMFAKGDSDASIN